MVTIAVPVTAATKADEAMQFEDFYRSQADRVYRALAITLTNHDLAREAADEATTRAYMHWAKVSRHDNPGGWATSRWRRASGG
ncbi:RNA polymerase sigma factor [Catelliglobosispora koreensis]|uniref:hypothetical protein n=1 Tax=Catelliglobosispora koreensis TaxID=129052 RepID=UPI00036C1255|nr:hypothetical protein [Catelliglobosispora koreensis]